MLVAQVQSLQSSIDAVQGAHDKIENALERAEAMPGQLLVRKQQLLDNLELAQGGDYALEPKEDSELHFVDTASVDAFVALFSVGTVAGVHQAKRECHICMILNWCCPVLYVDIVKHW